MKRTKEKTDEILGYFRDGATLVSACDKAGLHRTTLYTWRKSDPKLNADIEEAQTSRVQLVIDSLYSQAMKGNITACIFYLKNRAGWADKQETDLNVTVNLSDFLKNIETQQARTSVSQYN